MYQVGILNRIVCCFLFYRPLYPFSNLVKGSTNPKGYKNENPVGTPKGRVSPFAAHNRPGSDRTVIVDNNFHLKVKESTPVSPFAPTAKTVPNTTKRVPPVVQTLGQSSYLLLHRTQYLLKERLFFQFPRSLIHRNLWQ